MTQLVASDEPRSTTFGVYVSGVSARLREKDRLGKGASVRTGVIAIFTGGASVGVFVGKPYLAQAHSKKRLTPVTMAYETDLDNLATLNRQSTLHMVPTLGKT
jgi:hypothetical protein